MITSTSNERIKAAAGLSKRRNRRQTGTMLLEGVRLVRDAWQAGVRPSALFIAPELTVGNEPAKQLAHEAGSLGVEVIACSTPVFAKLAGTVTPQGIAAVVPLPDLELPVEVDLLLLLDRVRDPGNAGTLLRCAEAAGVQAVIFCPDTVDPFNDKVVRAGMGAHFRMPIRVCSSWSHVREFVDEGKSLYLADSSGERTYDAVNWIRPSALVIGGEAGGASENARAAGEAIRIPMLGSAESLNAGMAGAVILFEAARQRRSYRHNLG